jgi:2-methylcitrate dehydratase
MDRHCGPIDAPNAGPRKSWAAGDRNQPAVRLAMLVLKVRSATERTDGAEVGLYDVSFKGRPFNSSAVTVRT